MDIRLAVVDGHTLIRYGLRELAAQNPEIQIVAECSSMANAWSVLQAVQPDVVTADVTLPDGDGMQLARQLRDLRNDLGIVLLTSNAEDDVMFRALETGVSAFVPKTAPLEELLTAIQARRGRRLLVHRHRPGRGAGPAAYGAGSVRAEQPGTTSPPSAARRDFDPGDRPDDVHQHLDGQDIRRQAV